MYEIKEAEKVPESMKLVKYPFAQMRPGQYFQEGPFENLEEAGKARDRLRNAANQYFRQSHRRDGDLGYRVGIVIEKGRLFARLYVVYNKDEER